MGAIDLLNNAVLSYVDFDLPSNGLVYPGGIKTIKIRPTTTREEKFLATIVRSPSADRQLVKYLEAITDLGGQLSISDLTQGDQLALLIYSRIISKHQYNYQIRITCANCGKSSDHNADLTKLDIITLKDYKEPTDVKLEIHDLTLGLRLLRVKDNIELAEYFENMRRLGVKVEAGREEDPESVYAKSIMTIKKGKKEHDLPLSDKIELLENMDSASMGKIIDFQDEYFHGYDTSYPFVCPHCSYQDKTKFILGPDFFFRTPTKKH